MCLQWRRERGTNVRGEANCDALDTAMFLSAVAANSWYFASSLALEMRELGFFLFALDACGILGVKSML